MQLDERDKARLEYLLADFNAVKAEISRRASLQRVTLAAYVAVYAWIVPQIASDQVTSISIGSIWVAGALSLLFYSREGLEIARLAGLIRDRIASEAAQLLAATPEALIPSEMAPANPVIDRLTRRYNILFMWSVFFVIPALTTVLFVSRRWNQFSSLCNFGTSTPYITLGTLVAVVGTIILLRRRP